jgi:hypothetical protein
MPRQTRRGVLAQSALNAKSLSVVRGDVLLEGVVVEVLLAVGEVRARDA